MQGCRASRISWPRRLIHGEVFLFRRNSRGRHAHVLHPVPHLCTLRIVEPLHSPHEIPGDPPDTLEFHALATLPSMIGKWLHSSMPPVPLVAAADTPHVPDPLATTNPSTGWSSVAYKGRSTIKPDTLNLFAFKGEIAGSRDIRGPKIWPQF